MLASLETTFERLIDEAIANPGTVALGMIALSPVFLLAGFYIFWLIIRRTDDGLTMESVLNLVNTLGKPFKDLTDQLERQNGLAEKAISLRERELEKNRIFFSDLSQQVIAENVSTRDRLSGEIQGQAVILKSLTTAISDSGTLQARELARLEVAVQQLEQTISAKGESTETREILLRIESKLGELVHPVLPSTEASETPEPPPAETEPEAAETPAAAGIETPVS